MLNVARVVGVVVGLYLVARAIVEPFLIGSQIVFSSGRDGC
jgi:hypothetical protein